MEQTRPKRIVLGLTGGIAAYKSAELVRLLIKHGIEVQVVMTEAACHFISPLTLQALSGKPVWVRQWDNEGDGMGHIHLERAADAIVIAPATADFIAKLAHGLADDLLSSLCLARQGPLLVAPAMNRQMWENPATRRNIAQLHSDGVTLLGPASGTQACGEEGMGRMVEAEALARDILDQLQAHSAAGLLAGVGMLVTAGPTYEAMDAVRGMTNRSSGRMGYAVAQAALEAGARVTLISGPVALPAPQGALVMNVISAVDMFEAVKRHVAGCDVFVSVAAVADYRPAHVMEKKMKRGTGNISLELVPNPDILGYVAGLGKPPLCVGFAAETDHLREHARAKRAAKNIPLLVANLAQQAIGADESALTLFDDAGEHDLPRAPKLQQARALMRHIAGLYRRGGAS